MVTPIILKHQFSVETGENSGVGSKYLTFTSSDQLRLSHISCAAKHDDAKQEWNDERAGVRSLRKACLHWSDAHGEKDSLSSGVVGAQIRHEIPSAFVAQSLIDLGNTPLRSGPNSFPHVGRSQNLVARTFG
jgi:hypothetical protein